MGFFKSNKQTREYSDVSHDLLRAKTDFLKNCTTLNEAVATDPDSVSSYIEEARLDALWREAGLLKGLCERLSAFARDSSRNGRIKSDYLKIWKAKHFDEWWKEIDFAQEAMLQELNLSEASIALLGESEKIGFAETDLYLRRLFGK